MKGKNKLIIEIVAILVVMSAIIIMDKTGTFNKIRYKRIINNLGEHITVTLKYTSINQLDTGYASDNKFWIVDTDKLKMYKIEDYDVYSPMAPLFERGHHYKISKVSITDEDANIVKDYLQREDENIDNNDPDITHYYVINNYSRRVEIASDIKELYEVLKKTDK